jgi:hypothetical protein
MWLFFDPLASHKFNSNPSLRPFIPADIEIETLTRRGNYNPVTRPSYEPKDLDSLVSFSLACLAFFGTRFKD